MTDIMEQPAGRMLDSTVALNVMGIAVKWDQPYFGMDGHWDYARPNVPLYEHEPDEDGRTWHEVPNYSTSIASAWKVVERILNLRFYLDVRADPKPRQYLCVIATGGMVEMATGKAESAPLAVCRAALNLVSTHQSDFDMACTRYESTHYSE